MPNDNPQTTGNSLEWFAENLPPEYLRHPEYYLYSTALDVQKMQDISENRRRFKQLLVKRQVKEGIELPEIDQKQLHDFMNPKDKELKLRRSEELLELTTRHLEQTQDFAQAQRLAILELFHREAPFRQAEMDESYFRNREFVEADLLSYLKHTKGESLLDLSTSNPEWSVSVLTQNGEKVLWNTYLKRASNILLNTDRNNFQPADSIKALLKMLCIDMPLIMDEKYFNDPEIVEADLNAYLKHAKGYSLKDLSTRNPITGTSVLTKNGDKVRWETYLGRASRVLLGTTFEKDNCPRPSDALRALLKIIGIDMPVIMDKEYFSNPEFVKADLTAYLRHARGDSIEDLGTYNPEKSTRIQAQNNEYVRWRTYLNRASGVLFGTKDNKETNNPPRPGDALKRLKQIASQSQNSKSKL